MIATILAASLALATPPTEAEQTALWAGDRDQRMAWWREARFGMFIHWGLYSPACGFCDGSVHPTVPTLDGEPATQSDGAAP
jgi:alpha-L-fucosidase